MTIYEKLTASPTDLGEFLLSLPVIEGPWHRAFQRQFCDRCEKEECDGCPNEQYRANPYWWLSLEAEERGHWE